VAPPRQTKTKLYDNDGEPKANFNRSIKNWLEESERLREHTTPAAFTGLRDSYTETIRGLLANPEVSTREAHRLALSNLTTLMFGHDLAPELARLNPDLINSGGFRTTLSQGVAKNIGENFVNAIVYSLSCLLEGNDEVLVDKGMPPALKKAMTLKRSVPLATDSVDIDMPIEGDMSIFLRSDPLNAIAISAKTRLKEVFHIGTMWKLFFDIADDSYCLDKWGLESNAGTDLSNVLYLFATADMVNTGGRRVSAK